jgi:hypothetical protein
MWPPNVQPNSFNAEIARCSFSGDVATLTRAQYGTTAQAVGVGWQVAQNVTAQLLTSGGSTPGVSVVHAFPFAFDTLNILTGAFPVFNDGYVQKANDIVLDGWIQVVVAWNGTTPRGDISTQNGVNGFYCNWVTNNGIDMTSADSTDDGWLRNNGQPGSMLSGFIASSGLPTQPIGRPIPTLMENDNQLCVYVNTTGQQGGGDPGSTQGSAILYLVTATPA